MPQARLRIDLPEGTWIRDVSIAHPETEFRVLAVMPDGDRGVGLVEIGGPDIAAVVADMGEHHSLVGVDPLRASGDECLVEFETTEPLLLLPIQQSGVPLELPLTIDDGTAVVDLTASRERLSSLRDRLDALGLAFEVEYVKQVMNATDLLTETQRELLVTAVEAGYYDTPRRSTLTDLADELGMAKSTVSETLHRGEERVVKQFVSELVE
jgi:hypothetical protein